MLSWLVNVLVRQWPVAVRNNRGRHRSTKVGTRRMHVVDGWSGERSPPEVGRRSRERLRLWNLRRLFVSPKPVVHGRAMLVMMVMVMMVVHVCTPFP